VFGVLEVVLNVEGAEEGGVVRAAVVASLVVKFVEDNATTVGETEVTRVVGVVATGPMLAMVPKLKDPAPQRHAQSHAPFAKRVPLPLEMAEEALLTADLTTSC